MTITTLLYNQYLQTVTQPSNNSTHDHSHAHTPTIGFEPLVIRKECRPLPLQPCKLLALPLELRLKIWSYTISFQKPLRPKSPSSTSSPLLVDTISTSLLLANRQIYNEARLLPFQVNTFVFTKAFGSSTWSARRFLAKLSEEQCLALRRIEVTVSGREIVDRWRREEGWEDLLDRLRESERLQIIVKIRMGDVQNDDGDGKKDFWVAFGGNENVLPGPLAGIGDGDIVPVMDQGRCDWVHKLLEGGIKGEGVKVQYDRN